MGAPPRPASARLLQRARDEERAGRRRRIGRIAALGAVPLLVGAAAWVLLGSGWLEVRSVQVSGVERVTERLVSLTADVAPGTPLARVDLAEVEERVEQIPGVAEATATRGWPRTLRIEVVERRAVAVLAAADGGWRLLAADGRDFGSAPVPPQGALLVAGEPGDEVAEDLLRAAAAVAASLPADLAEQVAALEPRSADDVRLALVGGAEVRWGSAAQPAEKAAILRTLLQRPAKVYDVSTPQTPTTA